MTVLAANADDRSAGRAGTWLRGLCLLAGLVAFAWLTGQEAQRDWAGARQLPVTLGDAHYRVSPQQLAGLERFTEAYFSEGEAGARALVAAELAARLDHAFAGVSARLPAFADWYYSLAGEYTRLSMAALSWVNLADGEYVAGRAAAMLFPEGVWDAELSALEAHLGQHLLAHQEQVRAGWLAELTAQLSANRVPAPLPAHDDVAAGPAPVRLDRLARELADRERAALQTRLSLSTVAAGGVAAGPALWRAASRRSAASGARAAAARGAGRGAARAGSAAAGGAVACAPGGPAAVGCALAAGAATWLAADWALLRIDEAMNRADLMAALETSLVELRDEMENDMLEFYDTLIAAHHAGIQDDIHETFIPARAAGR